MPAWAIVGFVTAHFDIDTVRARLRRHRTVKQDAASRASVAMVLCEENAQWHLLFIRRAEHPLDPWSGHMALPGGRRDPSDPNDLSTAIRETREEVGLELERDAELLGAIDDLRATAKGRTLDLVVAPFVFCVKTLTPIVPSHEVVAAHWAPIKPLLDGTAQTELSVTQPGGVIRVPAWNVAGNAVWGLTYRMVCSFFALATASDAS